MGKIGIFDAGIGGLLVAKEVIKRLPNYDYVFLADNARNSYGSLATDEVYMLAERALDFLFSQDCDIILIASNTVTGLVLSTLELNYMPTRPGKYLLGIIGLTSEVAAARTYSGNVGVIASEGTVRSNAFVTEIHKLRSGVRVYQEACPMLPPLIETGQSSSETLKALLRTYLAPLQAVSIDALILGSPLYSLLKSEITKILGPRVRLIEEDLIAGEKVADYIARHPEQEKLLTKTATRTFLCTSKKSFDLLSAQLYGSPIEATQVTL